jgi:diguanylate cyclase (GGDEF)-like protein
MNRFVDPNRKSFPYIVASLTYAIYVIIFDYYHYRAGFGIAPLAIIPVIAGGWYFGIWGGICTALISTLSNTAIFILDGLSLRGVYETPGYVIGTASLMLIAFVVGRLATITRERKAAILKLEEHENARETHTEFLELLGQSTAKALEADSVQATLEILIEKIANLFSADDVYFTLWNAEHEVPIPILAFGSMKDIYPYMQFEPGEVTLTTSIMKAEHPIPVEDMEDSEYISPKVAAIFPSRSMLGIPLITQQRKLGAILLGYERKRAFDEEVIAHAEITAEQVTLVLSKSQSLEEERKQVRQLTALHDVALVSIEADNQDQLIEQVTNIIGHNLFPDNFGILLRDEEKEILRPHPSYRFHAAEKREISDVQLGQGISGEVARTGQPQRIGNVRRVPGYLDIDERTISELCVPIKFKERVLGVINAESTKRDAFTEDDERMLVTLAGQLATALEQLRRTEDERKWLGQLAHSNELIYSIAHITTQIEKSLTTNAIIETLGKELEQINLTCIMAVYDKSQKNFIINYTSLPPHFLDIVEAGLGYPLVQYTFPHRKLMTIWKADDLLRPSVISNPEEEINAIFTDINRKGIAAILDKIGVSNGVEPLRLPLVFEENLLGVLWVWGKDVTRSDLPIMSIFAKQIGISLERARLFQEVQSLALTDALTGLQNRRSIFELGRIEFSRAERMKRPFSCMMLDLDHFKKVNDDYGHQVGDRVLQEFAKCCQSSIREVDMVGRYGGEELIIMLPETDRDTAVQVAERLRTTISGHRTKINDIEVDITVSIGVATKDEHTTHMEALIARADQALYIAKHKGRNRVAISL